MRGDSSTSASCYLYSVGSALRTVIFGSRQTVRSADPTRIKLVSLLVILFFAASAYAGDLVIDLSAGMKPASASATASGPKATSDGEVKDQTVTFHKLLDGTPYDVKVILSDGTVLQGIDMRWYNDDPPKKNAGDFSDDDRKEVQAIMDVKSFYNKSDILKLNADHDRATVLTQLIRDTDFHSDKGGEIIWRIEVCYFQNQYGGWAKLNQTNKVIRRERFKTREEYEAATLKLQWTPVLGGIVVTKDGKTKVSVPAPQGPATKPAPAEDEPER